MFKKTHLPKFYSSLTRETTKKSGPFLETSSNIPAKVLEDRPEKTFETNLCATESPKAEVKNLTENVEFEKSFEEIPGPTSLPVFGTILKYLPIVGEYKFSALHKNSMINLNKYGMLVRERILPNLNLMHVYDPKDIETVFRNEGRYPDRRSHLALLQYRKSKPELYKTGGLIPTNGPEWANLRSTFQKALSRPQNVRTYFGLTDCIVSEFVNRIKHTFCVPKKVDDFLTELNRLNLELVCLIAFDVRLDVFSPQELLPKSTTSRLIKAAFDSNSSILKLDNGMQLWRYFNTPLYRKFCKSQYYIEQVAIDLITQKMAFFNEDVNAETNKDRPPSLLESYLSNPNIDLKDILEISVDLIMAGIDTTSYTTSFALYHLARNPDIQRMLFKESVEILPDRNSLITYEILSKAEYLKACLKESMRLNPVSIGVGRLLTEDVVLSGYKVPKGTLVVTQNMVACRSKKFFRDPEEFIPERWIPQSPLFEKSNPFLSLPFGFGPRSCIAKRMAEQNMLITILKIIRNFELRWAGRDMDVITLLINKPDQAIKLTFDYRTK